MPSGSRRGGTSQAEATEAVRRRADYDGCGANERWECGLPAVASPWGRGLLNIQILGPFFKPTRSGSLGRAWKSVF